MKFIAICGGWWDLAEGRSEKKRKEKEKKRKRKRKRKRKKEKGKRKKEKGKRKKEKGKRKKEERKEWKGKRKRTLFAHLRIIQAATRNDAPITHTTATTDVIIISSKISHQRKVFNPEEEAKEIQS